MRSKPVVLRKQAQTDIEDAIAYYLGEAGESVALAFIDAVEDISSSLATDAGIGSPRYALELDLPGLRSRALKRFPYLVFYVERGDHIDLWRMLHAHRDIPTFLQNPQET